MHMHLLPAVEGKLISVYAGVGHEFGYQDFQQHIWLVIAPVFGIVHHLIVCHAEVLIIGPHAPSRCCHSEYILRKGVLSTNAQARLETPSPKKIPRSKSLLPKIDRLEEQHASEDEACVNAAPDIVTGNASVVIDVYEGVIVTIFDKASLIDIVGESGCTKRLGSNTEDQCDLVDDKIWFREGGIRYSTCTSS